MFLKTLFPGATALALLQCVALAALCAPAQSQEAYPSKRFNFLIPYGAGSATDSFARIVGDGLAKQTGQPVIALNKPGANAMIAVKTLQTSPADGYSFAILANGIVIDQVLKKNPDFDIRKDLIPVARISQAPLGLFVSNNLPVNSVKDLIDYVRKNPGKVNYASAGVGSIAQLTTERFKMAAGLDMVHVPYPAGTGPMTLAMMAGDVGVLVNEMGSMRGFVSEKKLKILATLGDQRSPIYPDTPSVPELGLAELRNAFSPFFYGIFVAPGTDNAVVERLATEINTTLADPVTRDRLVALGYSPALLGGTRPADFRRIVNEELEKVEQVVRDAKITMQ